MDDDEEVFGGDSSVVAVEKRDCILLLEIMGERTTTELKPLVDEVEDRRRVTAVTMAAVGVDFMVGGCGRLYSVVLCLCEAPLEGFLQLSLFFRQHEHCLVFDIRIMAQDFTISTVTTQKNYYPSQSQPLEVGKFQLCTL